MDLIEMRKSVWQLGQDDRGDAAIPLAHVVAFECAYEAFGHPVRLRAAHRRMGRRNAELSCNGMRFMRVVRAAIVAQELQLA